MNTQHQQLCGSAEWQAHMQDIVLPAVTDGLALGDELLELGPGPGAATNWLRKRVRRLVAVESEPESATALHDRFAGSNVEVVHGDASALPFPTDSFDSVAAFTMLHHVPTRPQQARLLGEALRVLRPGGVLFGTDSLHSDDLHHFHHEDTYNPIEPATLLALLCAQGYVRIKIEVDVRVTFVAYKPQGDRVDPPYQG
jgi:ubiquinone/menaquinone biosynthesis C-methylase UbiE